MLVAIVKALIECFDAKLTANKEFAEVLKLSGNFRNLFKSPLYFFSC